MAGHDREHVTVQVQVGLQNGHAQLVERFEVAAESLEETLAILARFHELAERIRDEQAGLKGR